MHRQDSEAVAARSNRDAASTGPGEIEDTELVMGMGNLYHFYPDDLGISMGVRGWWESDNVFVIEGNMIGIAGEALYSRYSIIFDGDQVSIEAWVWGSEETLTYSRRLEG